MIMQSVLRQSESVSVARSRVCVCKSVESEEHRRWEGRRKRSHEEWTVTVTGGECVNQRDAHASRQLKQHLHYQVYIGEGQPRTRDGCNGRQSINGINARCCYSLPSRVITALRLRVLAFSYLTRLRSPTKEFTRCDRAFPFARWRLS